MSDWAQEMQALSGHWEAKGCWFTDTPQTLDWYARDMMVHPPIPFRVVAIHVPSDEAELYRVRHVPAARRFSRDWDTEFFVPKRWAQTALLDKQMTELVSARVEQTLSSLKSKN